MSAPKCEGKWPDQPLGPAFGLRELAGSHPHLASVLQEGRESANIDAGLGFIWRISAKTPARVRHRGTAMTINVENVLLFSCLVFFVTGIVVAAASLL
jgi:hypothetical protein